MKYNFQSRLKHFVSNRRLLFGVFLCQGDRGRQGAKGDPGKTGIPVSKNILEYIGRNLERGGGAVDASG